MAVNDSVAWIYVQDKSGHDLLNPENSNSFKLEDIGFEFYHDEGIIRRSGQFEINNPVIYTDKDNGSWLWLSPKAIQGKGYSENSWVRIYWPDNSVDTFDFEIYDDHKNAVFATKVYVNNTQVWPDPQNNPGGQRNIVLIK